MDRYIKVNKSDGSFYGAYDTERKIVSVKFPSFERFMDMPSFFKEGISLRVWLDERASKIYLSQGILILENTKDERPKEGYKRITLKELYGVSSNESDNKIIKA